MGRFRSAEELYTLLDALFHRLRAIPEIRQALTASPMIVRFRFHDPTGEVTIDLRQDPPQWTFGPSDLPADVEMIQSADTAHRFWMGQLNVPQAIATRQIIARGNIPKALRLLPALRPAFQVYPQVLRELGMTHLLEEPSPTPRRRFPRLRLSLPWRARPEVALPPPLLWPIPLVDAEAVEPMPPPPRPHPLPEDPIALRREMLRRMLLIRAFEETLAAEFARGAIPAETIHLSTGQEAVAVGVAFALRPTDWMTTTHRGHGHMLAKGADLDGMMAEIFGKAEGLCKGKGGSMHVTDARIGALGANGIVGASLVIGAGAALAAKLRGEDRVVVAFCGDGATNQGMFHEALNFAAVFQLPLIVVIENNQYAEFTPLARHTRVTRLADRAAAYGIPGVHVDGNDVWAVYEATREAVARARQGEGPTLIEALTYRWRGHSEGEGAVYRSAAEVEAWKARDPIRRWRERLEAEGLLTPSEAQAIEAEAWQRVQEAAERARRGTEPPPEALTEDLYAPEPAWLYGQGPMILRPSGRTRERSTAEALREALAEEMAWDPRVFLLGEDVTTGGYFGVTTGLGEEFPGRVLDTPISESAIIGAAVGAAMAGMRPVAEIEFADFLTCAMDGLVNQAAKIRYMSGGQYALPLVVRTPAGGGIGMAAQHSQSLEPLLTGVPGLIVVAPGTPADAKGLLKAAIRSNNPVVFFENKLLYAEVGPVPEGEWIVPLGVAEVKRPGRDVTVVSIGAVLSRVLEAAAELAREGIEVEIVDVRTLVPLDLRTILASVARTRRLVVVEDAPLTHGFGAEVIARVSEAAWGLLRAAPRRVAGQDVPIPYNRTLERLALPDAPRIAEAVREVLR